MDPYVVDWQIEDSIVSPPIDRLTVAPDSSGMAEQLVPYATSLAIGLGARLALFHAIPNSLVVICHGRSGLQPLVLGSVASRVVREPRVAAIVVPPLVGRQTRHM